MCCVVVLMQHARLIPVLPSTVDGFFAQLLASIRPLASEAEASVSLVD